MQTSPSSHHRSSSPPKLSTEELVVDASTAAEPVVDRLSREGRGSCLHPAPSRLPPPAGERSCGATSPAPLLRPMGTRRVEDLSALKVRTPQLQDRRERKLQLANGLQVFLVSDPGTELAAAAMTVQAGGWQDLPKHPGTAHLLEHMLFMGSRQFPDEAEYGRYLAQHGGLSNAHTGADHTCFLFACDNSALSGGLRRFAGFFIDPMLENSCIHREVMVVDAEYRGYIDREGMRSLHVQATQNNPAHPASRFLIGSAKTLGASTAPPSAAGTRRTTAAT